MVGRKKTKCEVFIRNHIIGDDNLYEGIFVQPVEMEGTKYPLYKQVLELEAIELHKLESSLKKKGAIIMDRNTDAIRYISKPEIELEAYWDDDKLVEKYQKEEPKPLVFELNYDTKYDYEFSVEEEAQRIVESGASIHIDGRAGTGKTTLLNAIRNKLKEQKLEILAFSPTNKGARLIGGKTIHTNINPKKQICSVR